MCASYSPRKYRSVVRTGFGAVRPSPQMLPCVVRPARARSSSRSAGLPLPKQILSRISYIRVVPIRQNVHWPHDSSRRNDRKYRAISTMQSSSSRTMSPPDPMIAPAAASASKSTVVPASAAGMQPPDGPPICTALNFFPFGTPPPMSSMISRIVIPIGTSMSPARSILPASANTFVPLLFSVPNAANASAPWRTIHGIIVNVSTLLISVGRCHSPQSAG